MHLQFGPPAPSFASTEVPLIVTLMFPKLFERYRLAVQSLLATDEISNLVIDIKRGKDQGPFVRAVSWVRSKGNDVVPTDPQYDSLRTLIQSIMQNDPDTATTVENLDSICRCYPQMFGYDLVITPRARKVGITIVH